MAIMVRFYENGTMKKERQWKESEEELKVARVHLDMVNAQLKALKVRPLRTRGGDTAPTACAC